MLAQLIKDLVAIVIVLAIMTMAHWVAEYLLVELAINAIIVILIVRELPSLILAIKRMHI